MSERRRAVDSIKRDIAEIRTSIEKLKELVDISLGKKEIKEEKRGGFFSNFSI